MIRSRFPLLRTLAVLACTTAMPHARSESVTLRLLAFARVGDAREVMITGPDGKPLHDKPVSLPTEQLSAPVDIAGRSLAFQAPAAVPPAAPPADIPPSSLGKVDLPGGGKEFLLIFLPAAKGAPMPYRVAAVPLPRDDFGSGAQAFVNYCGSAVGFTIGGEKLMIPDGKSGIYRPKEAKGVQSMTGYQRQPDGKWSATPFYSSRLIVQEGVRNLILIFRNPRTGAPDFRGIADFVTSP